MGEGNFGIAQKKWHLYDITAAPMYPHMTSERVKEWQAEIGTVNRANILGQKVETSDTREVNRQRRPQRLRSIMHELKVLTEWKKV
jgi:hypothetical protein